MKTCKYCNKEFDDNLTFCPFCGKENADKKLTYIEKKQAREKDTEVILSKASIQDEESKNAHELDVSAVFAEKVDTLKKLQLFSIIRIVAAIVIMIGCIVWAQLTLRNDYDSNVKLVIVIVAYFAVAVAATILISDIYTTMAYKNLKNTEFSLRKINFTKGPMFFYKDNVYEIKTNENCKQCDGELHVEDKDDEIYLVCSKNRAHLYKVNKEAFIEVVKSKIE